MKTPNIFLPLCIFMLLLSGTAVNAQEQEEGLRGQTLEIVKRDCGGGILGKLLQQDKENNCNLNVTVVEDGEDYLTLELDYTSFENGRMSIVTKSKFKREQRFIPKQEISLKGKLSPLEVTLSLGRNAPKSFRQESAYLEIKIVERKMGALPTPKIFLYKLGKKWERKIKKPTNVNVTLTPVGSAASLKESDKNLLKPKFKPRPKNPRDGIWINNNPHTKDISKILISGNAAMISIYEKCNTKDCERASEALSPEDPKKTYSTQFSDEKAVYTLKLDFNKGLKVTQTITNKKDNKIITTEAVFRKQPPLPQGPDNNSISLWGNIKMDTKFEFAHELSNIHLEKIYPDKNPESGVFYYLPDAYHLRWNPGKGYHFKMLYGTANDDALSGNIRMTGVITPAIDNTETDLVKVLLKAYVQNNSIYTYKELRIMPLKSNPNISFSGLKGQYSISSDRINVGVQSAINAPIDISWVTDNKTNEEMKVALSEGVGIQGTMTLAPDSESIPERLVPVRIALADPRTLGRFTLQPKTWRTEKWENKTPYPIKLKYIHALVIKKEGGKHKPFIYSWSLGDKEVPSKGKVKFDTAAIPEWLDKENKTERIWIDYTVSDCPSCVSKVMDELTGGTSGSKVKNITLESFKVFQTLDAAKLSIKIRSRQVDPKGYKVGELPPIHIEKDNSVYSSGPLYLPDGKGIRYEYFFTLVMTDGTTYRSDGWRSSREPEMYIGLDTLKDAMSSMSLVLD